MNAVFGNLVVPVKTLEPSQTARFVRARVHAVESVIDTVRSDGAHIRVSEALVGDETGCVILTVRGGAWTDSKREPVVYHSKSTIVAFY